MRTEEALFRHLSGVAGVTALLGSGTDCRIYDEAAPDLITAPFAVMELQADEREAPLSGVPTAKVVTLTFSCYGNSTSVADAIAEAIYAALIGFSGTMGGGPVVQGCMQRGRRASPVPDYDTGSRLFLVELDFDLTVNL